MSTPCRPLMEVLAEIPEVRQARGKRYALVPVLALACAATLCGYRGYPAIAEWGRHYGGELLVALGFTRGTSPCAATLSLLFRRLDVGRVEAVLGQGAQEVLAALPPAPGEDEALGCDGKTLRGSRKHGAAGTHLLSVLSHRLGLTVAQAAVDDKTNEITALHALLTPLLVAGRVLTMDALLTQRAIAQAIVEGQGDDVMVAKDNQPGLRSDISAVLATPSHLAQPVRAAQTQERGHGRLEQRRLTLRALRPGDCAWPGAQQVFRIERRRVCRTTGVVQTETTEGVTSLAAAAADPLRLLRLLRGHWHSENKSHWVRDMTFDEDRSQVRVGAIPAVMAARRNTIIGLLRCTGRTTSAGACRFYAAQPWQALALLTSAPRTK